MPNFCYLSVFFRIILIYEGVSKSFRTGRLERGLHMVQLSTTRCSCIAILWVSLVSFAAITLHFASQRVFIFVNIYFVIDSVRKRLYTHSYFHCGSSKSEIYFLCSAMQAPTRCIPSYHMKVKSLCLTNHHAMKTYCGSGDTAPRILKNDTRRRWLIIYTLRPLYPLDKSPRYPLCRRLSGPQSRSKRCGEVKNPSIASSGNWTPVGQSLV
jgi:hypothetical protein